MDEVAKEKHVVFLSGKTEDEVWEYEFPDLKIDENTREIAKKLSHRYRGSVRMSTGLFYTDTEWEEKRKRILNTPLP